MRSGLMTPQATLIPVSQAEIDERVKGQSGMPTDIVMGLSREDVRDLVEFPVSLKAGPDAHQ